jgi:hypothetical protein
MELLLATLLLPAAAQAQANRNCVSASALQLQPIIVVPEVGYFSYRRQVFNAGRTSRNFSYHFPLAALMPPPGAVSAFNIRSRQTITIQLGTTQQRASDQALRDSLRITCHS